jgi:hypothetical protein
MVRYIFSRGLEKTLTTNGEYLFSLYYNSNGEYLASLNYNLNGEYLFSLIIICISRDPAYALRAGKLIPVWPALRSFGEAGSIATNGLKRCIEREHEGRTLVRIALREWHLPEETQAAIRSQIIVHTYVAQFDLPRRSAFKYFRQESIIAYFCINIIRTMVDYDVLEIHPVGVRS